MEVSNRVEQDRIVEELVKLFPNSRIDDRRQTPSHGYRAVHVIVTVDARPVETQVRTTLQNTWAQATERLADRFDVAVKYGGGPEAVRQLLELTSNVLNDFEELEKTYLLGPGALPTLAYEAKAELQGLLRTLILQASELEA